MTTRLSEMKGLEIFTESGKMIGVVQEFIINLETGTVVKILLEPMTRMSSEDLREFLAKKSINYSRVKNVSDAIIIDSK
ncbi:MAG: PRC-barrel domain-containing protein [Candidatus Micrarchaeota archaeon]